MGWFEKKSKPSVISDSPNKQSTRPTAMLNPVVIASPVLGTFNLLGAAGEPLIGEDRKNLSSLFARVVEGQWEPPVCDVLLLYCEIDNDGDLKGMSDSLRTIICKSHATIVIVASPNSGDAYVASTTKAPGQGRANLVMVIDRKAAKFGTFFQNLFTLMYQGKTMPMAWGELVPQTAAAPEQLECPMTIFACEAGHIAFKIPETN